MSPLGLPGWAVAVYFAVVLAVPAALLVRMLGGGAEADAETDTTVVTEPNTDTEKAADTETDLEPEADASPKPSGDGVPGAAGEE